MSSYVQSVLIDGESHLYSGYPSLWPFSGKIMIAAVMLLGGLFGGFSSGHAFMYGLSGVGVLLLGVVYIHYKSIELAITDKRIIVKSGFIRRDSVEINLSKVESIQVEQSLLGRLFNFGTVVISSGGGPEAEISDMHAPIEFRKQFVMATDKRQS